LHVRPLQHALEAEQLCPVCRHTGAEPQTPPLHVRPLQHGLALEQSWPLERHTGAAPHTPPEHESPAQQPAEAEQSWPLARQVAVPTHRPVDELQLNPLQQGLAKTPVQSSPLMEQLPPPPPVPATHCPPLHALPLQQSDDEPHDSPGIWQSCRPDQQVPCWQYRPLPQSTFDVHEKPTRCEGVVKQVVGPARSLLRQYGADAQHGAVALHEPLRATQVPPLLPPPAPPPPEAQTPLSHQLDVHARSSAHGRPGPTRPETQRMGPDTVVLAQKSFAPQQS